MSQYHITRDESPISFSRINEALRNNPNLGITSNNQSNSILSIREDQSYHYLLSQNINNPKLKPIRFSDFRNNVFIGVNITSISETPSQYGTNNNGGIRIVPFGGTGANYNVKIKVLNNIIFSKTFTSGGQAESPRNLDSRTYTVIVTQLDETLVSINSFEFSVAVGYGFGAGYNHIFTPIVIYPHR